MPPLATGARTWIEMRNVDLRVNEHTVLKVRRLHGEVLRTTPRVVFLDDTRSFAIRIVSGTVSLTGDALTALLNDVAFGYPGSPLKHLKVRVSGSHVIQTGVMHKGVDLPFEMTASLAVLPDGRVQVHPVKIKILGINGGPFLHAVGLHLEQLLDLSKSPAASVHGDDIYLDVSRLLPPPRIQGRLVSIRVHDDLVTQEFARLPDDSVFGTTVRPDSTVPNFVYFRGGDLRFGKLLMSDTDLLITDAAPRDPFDLYLARYNRQLVRGTSRTLPNLGLVVVMPDYAAIPH